MRTGEVSFPVLMTRYFATPLACSLAALLWFRLMDLHAVAAVALFPVGGRWVDRWRVGLLVVVWLSLPCWSFQIQPSSAAAFPHLFVLGLSLVGGALALLLHPDIAAPTVSNDHG